MGGKRKKGGGREQMKERQGFGRITELQKASCKSQAKNGRGLH